MKKISGGVCAPAGFRANGVHCGIRKNKEKKDWKPKGTERFVLCIFNSKYRSVKPI